MDTADEDRTLARYKKALETAAQLKPDVLAITDRRLRAGATNKELAEATGLTTEFFRKRARDIGADNRQKPPTVGREADARRAAETTTVAGRAEHEAERQTTPAGNHPWYIAHLTPTQVTELATIARANPNWTQQHQAIADTHPEDADRAVVAHATEQRILTATDYQHVGAEAPPQ